MTKTRCAILNLRQFYIYFNSVEKTKLQEKDKKTLVYLDYQMWVFFILPISISAAFFFEFCVSLGLIVQKRFSMSRNRKPGQVNNTLVFIADGYKQTEAN